MRYMDRAQLLSDLNLDLMSLHANENDEMRVLLEGFLTEFGLDRTYPHKPTWSDSRGSHSRIDDILFSGGSRQPIWSEVLQDSDTILGSDHKCCTLALQDLRKSAKGRALAYTHMHRCGKWKVDLTHAPGLCDALHEQLDCLDFPLTDTTLQGLAAHSCHGPGSLRYKDGPEIKRLINLRRHQTGSQARETAQKIVTARALVGRRLGFPGGPSSCAQEDKRRRRET